MNDLGKKLRAIRAKAAAKGMRLLTLEEVLHKVARRRGGSVQNG